MISLTDEKVIEAVNRLKSACVSMRTGQANALGVCADTFAAVRFENSRQLAESIESMSLMVSAHFDELIDESILKLREKLSQHDRWGSPPPFISIAGQSRLEKPFNRLLAWWSNTEAEHGLAKEFLNLLAQRVDLPEMVEDLKVCVPEVYAEQPIEGITDGRMPDLMIRTPRAALMLENKVEAGESGDQYGPYHGYLDKWAENRHYRALLCARETRETPDGWDGFIRHADIAEIFEQLWNFEQAPVWGKIAAKLSAVSFRNEASSSKQVAEAKKLLGLIETGRKKRSPGLLTDMENLFRAIPEPVALKEAQS